MSLSLYHVAAEYREALDVLSSMDIDAQTLADTLESLDVRENLDVKAVNVVYQMRNMEVTADAIESAAADMIKRAKIIRNRISFFEQNVLDAMLFTGVQKIECPHFVIAVRKNPESVKIDDEKQIPKGYFVDVPAPPPQLSKKLIAAAIKAGKEVPGARLAAGVRLEIK